MTVEEILRQSGFTDEQIKALEPKAITAFNGVISAAEQERQRAEVERRANSDFYDTQIVPSLTAWEEEKSRMDNARAQAEASAAYYKEAARAAGVAVSDAPGFTPRDQSGRYVAGVPGGTPGSPTYSGPSAADIDQKLGQGLSNVAWAMQTHQQLTGQVLPDSFDRLAAEATASRLPFRDYVSKKYDYVGKQQEQARKAQEAHDAEIAAKATAENDRKWAERVGSNPDVRMGQDSRFGSSVRAQKQGLIPDPLMLDENARRQATRSAIRTELTEQDK